MQTEPNFPGCQINVAYQEKQHQTQAEQIRAPARLPRGGHLIEQVLHPQGTAKWAFKLPTPLPVSNGGSAN